MEGSEAMRQFEVKEPGSHFDHLIRQTRLHHQQISMMIDTKANMLITISSLIITLSAPLLLKPELEMIAISLIISGVFTVLFAVYAVMPKKFGKTTTRLSHEVPFDAMRSLFFGNFINIPYEEFERAWEGVLKDHALAYRVQVREIYDLGQYLAKEKLRYVRLAYLSFLCGILSAVASVVYLFLIPALTI
ncbi:hypothetical protein EBR25_00615 [bacterium]|nr:hypothetical protein [bacterium]